MTRPSLIIAAVLCAVGAGCGETPQQANWNAPTGPLVAGETYYVKPLEIPAPWWREGQYVVLSRNNKPVRITKIRIEIPDDGEPFWVCEYKHPDHRGEPNDDREDEFHWSEFAEQSFDREVARLNAEWTKEHPHGWVGLSNGVLTVREISFNDSTPPRNLIEHQIELKPTYVNGQKLVSVWLTRWLDADTDETVYAPNKQDVIVGSEVTPYGELPPEGVFTPGEIGQVWMIGNQLWDIPVEVPSNSPASEVRE